MITLKTDRLTVEITEPGEGTNNGAHWDRAAFLSRLTLDGIHEFCAHEPDVLINPMTGDSLNHATGGIGLCSEIVETESWEAAGIGDPVPKFGVGLVTKGYEGRYKPYIPCQVIPFEVTVKPIENGAVFETAPMPCGGYALRERKTVTLHDTSVTVEYFFRNEGEKPLTLSEYVHNYVTINRLSLGKDYTVTFPSARDLSGKKPRAPESTVYGKGNAFTFSGYSATDQMIHLTREDLDPDQPFSWIMTHASCPAWIREEDSFLPSRVPFWSIDHILSAEVNHLFTLSPGESCTYWRKWTVGD